MHGVLVTNHYLKGEKYDILHKHLMDSAEKIGISLEHITNFQAIFSVEKYDFALFWDKDVQTAELMENRGIRVFNSASSIALCDNKVSTYLHLQNTVKQPKTLFPPLSFFSQAYSGFVEKAVAVLGLPLVFKECCGSFGAQVFLCRTADEIMSHIGEKPFLLQEYIECNNSDVRIEVVGNEAVAAMRRYNPDDFRSNITNGGTAEPYEPTDSEKELAITACSAIGLDFGGVDIIGGDIVCEVNSNAHIINLAETTGIDVAPMIFGHIGECL